MIAPKYRMRLMIQGMRRKYRRLRGCSVPRQQNLRRRYCWLRMQVPRGLQGAQLHANRRSLHWKPVQQWHVYRPRRAWIRVQMHGRF